MSKELSSQVVALIHHVQLNEAGWWRRTIERFVAAVLWLESRPLDRPEIESAVRDAFGIAIQTSDSDEAIGTLITRGEVLPIDGFRFKLAEEARLRFERDAEKIDAVEVRVEREFTAAIDGLALDNSTTWDRFRNEALVPVIRHLGAKTYELLQTSTRPLQDLAILQRFLDTFPSDVRDALRSAIRRFLASDSSDLRAFLLAHMTASFCLEAGRLSEQTLNHLAASTLKPPEFRLLLDTNFIYSVLGLHDNPSNDAAVSLINVIQKLPPQLSVRLYVLLPTIHETRRNLQAHLDQVIRIQTTPGILDAARRARLSGVLEKYFNECGTYATQAQARDYFGPYIEDLVGILRSKGVELYNQDVSEYHMRQDVIDDINMRLKHQERNPSRKQRGYDALLHDVVLWHVAMDKRQGGVESPLDAKFWVVTIDYRFLGWDLHKRQEGGERVQVCLHPTSLLQMLQFWIPRDTAFDEALVDAMRMPFFFQEFDAEAERITLSILSAISRFENAADLNAATVERVVLNNALRSRIALPQDDQQQVELIREALAADNKKLAEQLQAVRERADRRVVELGEAQQEVAKLSLGMREADERRRAQTRALVRRVRRKARIWALSICGGIALLMAFAIWVAVRWAAPKWDLVEAWWSAGSFCIVAAGTLFGIDGRVLRFRPLLEGFIYNSQLQRTLAEFGLTKADVVDEVRREVK